MFRTFSILIIFLMLTSFAQAGEAIGLSLPLKGRIGPVAERVEFGARLALQDLNSNGRDLQLVLVDDGCEPKNAVKNANEFLKARVKIVVGPLCFKYATALARALNTENSETPAIPVIAINTRNNLLKRLRNVDELPLYSLSGSFTDEARAVVKYILPRFEGKPFAVIDDGSVYGRSLAENVSLLGEQAGFKPIITTDFRPLQSSQTAVLRRLKNSGVEAVFIAAGASDLITISRDLARLELNWILGAGEQAELIAYSNESSDVPTGFLMVRESNPKEKPAATLLEKLNGKLEPNVLMGYSLIQIAASALEVQIAVAALEKEKILLDNVSFETVLGKLKFNEEGRAFPPALCAFSLGRR